MQYFGYIVLSIVILLVMVLIHEAGHYTLAKLLGFTVDEFSIGFGPKLLSRRRKNGELFSVRMLPLGGYCAFYGEAEDEAKTTPALASDANKEKTEVNTSDNAQDTSDDLLSYVMHSQEAEKEAAPAPQRTDKDGKPAKTFFEQKPWKRIIVLFGGVLFNFLSAFIFAFIYIWAVGYAVPEVSKVYEDAHGQPYCNLQAGDIVLAVDGKNINVLNGFSDLTAKAKEGQTVTLKVERNGEIISVEATKQSVSYVDDNGESKEYVGFGIVSSSKARGRNAGTAFLYCVPYTFKLSWAIIGTFFGLFTGKTAITTISGPVGSVNIMAKSSVEYGWQFILILLPLLASNLAIFNLLPFPALDGAHIVFTTIEWIRGKPINRNVESMIHFVGLIVLLLFVLIVDILSFVL